MSIRDFIPTDRRLRQIEAFFDTGFAVTLDTRFQSIDELLGRLRLVRDGKNVQGGEDPVLFARRASQALVQRSRAIQLVDFGARANGIINKLVEYVNGIAGNLDRFQARADQIATDQMSLPAGYDIVGTYFTQIRVGVGLLGVGRLGHWCFAASKSEYVLLSRTFSLKAERQEAEGDWEPLSWYQQSSSEIADDAMNHVKDWLRESMDCIAKGEYDA